MSNKLEKMLREAGRELADHQVARFFKIPEEMAQTPCDFIGYTVAARGILIEAKMVERKSLPIGDAPGLSKHQWNELCDANRAGCIALICWSRGLICSTIPVSLAIVLAEGRRSIPWHAIPEDYQRPMMGAKAHLRLLDRFLPIPQLPTPSSMA